MAGPHQYPLGAKEGQYGQSANTTTHKTSRGGYRREPEEVHLRDLSNV
jgi:hypothetical protein